MAKVGELYHRDFVLWTEEQAAGLRHAKGSNLRLDWENVADEIESLGISQRGELRSHLRRILRHLFKLAASPAAEPRGGWLLTVLEARAEIEDLLEESPSLRREIDGMLQRQAPVAAKLAAADLSQHNEPTDAVSELLRTGRFTVEQVLGDWFP